MSDNSDDDGDGRGEKSNTGREHKPKNAKNNDNAPTGHLGMQVVFTPSPNLVRAISKARSTDEGKSSQSGKAAEKPDNRPLAARTGDKEVDDHYGKDHRLITESERNELAAKNSVTENPKTQTKGGLTAKDIFAKFAGDKVNEKDKGL